MTFMQGSLELALLSRVLVIGCWVCSVLLLVKRTVNQGLIISNKNAS